MPNHSLDSTTLLSCGDDTTLEDARLLRGPALTILWHPDVARVGACALLADEVCDVSRLSPGFGDRSRGSIGAPLADLYVSAREPSFAIQQVGDTVEILLRSPTAHVRVGGARLRDRMAFPRAALDAGVIITLARRIVLCLHLARPARLDARTAHGLIGVSDSIDDVRREIDQVADLDVPVLIRGETGTGKGVVAAALVAASPRQKRPFLSLNMGATVPSTAASELFGHERGSFTGATSAKEGLFGVADGGSLFLDEIGLTPPEVQSMLLRVLESGEIRALGSNRPRKVDVRFIAATDADLERAIAAGGFSEALRQRLARYQIAMPPLRLRREDFGVLLVHFLRAALTKYGEPNRLSGIDDPWLTASTVAGLAAHAWPGNVRELENIAGQIVVSSRGQTVAILPVSVRAILADRQISPATPETPAARPGGPDISDQRVAEALARSNGSASRAAKILGVSRTTYYQLRKRNPLLRSITEISDEEILACRDQAGGDVTKMAARLGVPVKALKDRLAHLSRGPR